MVLRTFQNIQTDAAELVDIRVVDLCEEANLWRRHRVIIGEKEFEPEYTTFFPRQLEWLENEG